MFPVDQEVFRITLRQVIGTRGVGIAVKVGSIQRNGLIERLLFIPRRGAQDRIQPAADANFCKGSELCFFFYIIFPHSFDQAYHTLLGQVFTVSPSEEKGPGTGAYQAVISCDEDFFRHAASGRCQGAKLLIRSLVQRLYVVLIYFAHFVLYPPVHENVKQIIKITGICC